MRSRVFAMVQFLSVHPVAAVESSQDTPGFSSMEPSSKCGQCHINSEGVRLNTDLLLIESDTHAAAVFKRKFYSQ